MKPIITNFNDETGDFEITIPVPFTERDVLGHTKEITLDILKYEDIEYYNIFDLIRENQKLKKQLDNYKNRYKNYLNNKLSEDVEPDFEDYHLAEIEWKANEYDKLFERNNRLREVNKAISKGLQKILLKRNKWKKRYETEHRKKQELNRDLKGKESKQKEFIEWLENKLEKRNNDIKLLGQDVYTSKFAYQEILSKYKEIIGSDK